MKNKDPWPGQYIATMHPSKVNLTEYTGVLKAAKDEAPLQAYLAQVPSFFRTMLPACPDAWCFDRKNFGGVFIPDFLLCYRNSTGFTWVLVELESPMIAPLNKNGRPSGKLTEAMSQIRDWRMWLRKNIAYAHSQLGLRQINAEFKAWIVLGRRSMIDTARAERYAELSTAELQVMTYDRILECAASHQR